MKKNNQKGYILILTLALIALAMFLSTYVYYKGTIFVRFSDTMIDREKARQLAYGGIQLAISQLSLKPEKEAAEISLSGKSSQATLSKQDSDGLFLLKNILPLLNSPQKFVLKQAIEGVEGTLIIAWGSEEGKFNINQWYDFTKHKFVGEGQAMGDMKIIAKEVFNRIKEIIGEDLFAPFEKYLKEQKFPLNDVTQLLLIPEFEQFKDKLFYDPSTLVQDEKKKLYLTDLFTVFSSKREIEPWLFSESVKVLLKLSPERKGIETALKNFKEQADWKTEWNKSVKHMYNVDYGALPKSITSLFASSFAPKLFWVFSQAIIGHATVAMLALLEREKGSSADAAPAIKIRKIYLV